MIKKLLQLILNAIGVPKLVYKVIFSPGAPPVVVVNQINFYDPLWIATSPVTVVKDQHETPMNGPLTTVEGNGALTFRITRPPGPDDAPLPIGVTVAVTCVLSPAPPFPGFTLVANGSVQEIESSPVGPDDMWAVVLTARDGDKSDISTSTMIVGATHQVRAGAVALGTAGNPATPAIEIISRAEAYPDLNRRTFTLETDIDCYAGRGYSRLRTVGHTWPERSWSHPFIRYGVPVSPSPPTEVARLAPQITAVGVGLAMASGIGTPIAHIYDFAIYAWDGSRPFWYPIISGLLKYR